MPATVELTQQITEMRDYPIPLREGGMLNQKRVTFYLGKFGPFVEMFPVEGFSSSVVQSRIDALKRQLEDLHR